MAIRPEIGGCVKMPVDDKCRTGNSLRSLYDKMILKNSRVANLWDEVFGFVEGSGWTRCLTMRERIDPGCSPVRGNPNYHCGVKSREGDYRKSIDIGLQRYHRSSLIIAKTAGFRQQNYPHTSF